MHYCFFLPACVRRVVSCCVSIHAKQSKRYELGPGTSLHRLVQVAPLVGAEGVEGGHHKLAVEGSARQQPLGLFGITGVAVFYKDLWTHGGSVTEVQSGQSLFTLAVVKSPDRKHFSTLILCSVWRRSCFYISGTEF